MLKAFRIRRAHSLFLESCRNLTQERGYWDSQSKLGRWILQVVCPVPLVSLTDEGVRLANALQWLESNCCRTHLTDEVLRKYHHLAMGDIPRVGVYRKCDMVLTGKSIPLASPTRVLPLMGCLSMKAMEIQARWDNHSPTEDSVLEFCVDLYQRLGYIHPFEDGNGRVSRLAVNHLLRRYGFGYVIFPSIADVPELMDALQEGHKGRNEHLFRIAKASLSPI